MTWRFGDMNDLFYSKALKDEKVKISPPARKDRLRESQESNKENSARCDSLTERQVEQLVAEGFDQIFALRALHISQNNIEMAREILQEFVPHPQFWPMLSLQ